MTPELRRRLADILPRLASDHDGEVVATARAASRVLRSAGHDWHDLCALIVAAEIPEGRPSDDTSEWKIQVETALRLQLWRTDWERDFLHGLQQWNGEPTEKQRAVLQRIFDRGG